MRQFILYQTAVNRDDLVAAFPVKAGDCRAVERSHRKDALVAVCICSLAADDIRRKGILLSDAPQGVIDLVQLKAQLLLIAHVAAVAAAAFAVAGTARIDPGGGGEKQRFPLCPGAIFPDLQDADFPFLTRNRARNKDNRTVNMTDPGGVRAVRVDGNAKDLIFSYYIHVLRITRPA